MAQKHLPFGTVKEAAGILRKHAPAPLPMRVRRVKLGEGVAGWCHLRERTKKRDAHYEIQLCSTLAEDTAVLLLIHEWAHALSWADKDHGAKWGAAYARCFQALQREWHS